VTGSKQWQESGKKDAQEGINEMKVCFLLFNLVSGGFSPGYLIADPGINRQRTQRRLHNQQQAVLADELRSWLERRPAVRVWRRRDWRDRRHIDTACGI
jgi:hypothetical protein